MGFDGHQKYHLLPLVYREELVDFLVKFSKRLIEVQDLFAKKKDKDGDVVVEDVGPYLIK